MLNPDEPKVIIKYRIDWHSPNAVVEIEIGKTKFLVPWQVFERANIGENDGVDWRDSHTGQIKLSLTSYRGLFKERYPDGQRGYKV